MQDQPPTPNDLPEDTRNALINEAMLNPHPDDVQPHPDEVKNIMFGYGMSIRRLTRDDLKFYDIDLGQHRLENCVAVLGEDLAESMAAVIDLSPLAKGHLVWLDLPLRLDPRELGKFAECVMYVLVNMFPHLTEIDYDWYAEDRP